ncbi:uncharacterized protein LOC128469989 isoform X2 [Spea bombifrons]|uniref:uncharacterized protein LOC128469989 isoform X2 n=1 Tax=Spea bombifrons TaxID=233779 RepID=UPI00234B94A1|nr:uncharacterized protein LOC128469989 isoform X2 [Spea bombifrons]XP_053307782.1 uncharacterized protein LOC128469989 isoform X2 [Spea bombifrons]
MSTPVPVTFHDVVASFTEEQWTSLERGKRELYQNVIKQIHNALLTLGYTIVNPDTLFRITKEDEACVRIEYSSDHNDVVPDLLLKIKEEAADETPCSEEELNAAYPVIHSVISLNIKQEREVCKKVSMGSEAKPKNHPDTQEDNLSFVKEEEEMCSIDNYNHADLDINVICTSPPTAVKEEDISQLLEIQPTGRYRTDDEPIKQEMDDQIEGHAGYEHTDFTIRRHEYEEESGGTNALSVKRIKVGFQAEGGTERNHSNSDSSDDEERRRRLIEIMDRERHSRPTPPFLLNCLEWVPDRREECTKRKPPAAPVRVGDTAWCSCGGCVALPTDDECVCCTEIKNIEPLLSEGKKCICDSDYVRDRLVSREHIISLYRYSSSYSKLRLPRMDDLKESDYRKTAYRAFCMWAYGRLGRKKGRPIPACVVHRIRTHFPKPDKTYLGLVSASYDPNAVDMLD